MFSRKCCEISHKTFFKEPFGQLLLHKHSLYLLSHHDNLLSLKRVFSGLNLQTGTRVSSIFQTLSQKSEAFFQPSRTSAMEFFAKIVNSLKPLSIFAKNAPLWMVVGVLNTLSVSSN